MAAKRKAKSRASSARVNTSGRKLSQSKSPKAKAKAKAEPAKANLMCPIVGIGGSAGGFEASMDFLRHLPPENGMAFVIIQHLDPHHASRLPNLLGRATAMPVIEVAKRVKPAPNTVYVQPANKCVI